MEVRLKDMRFEQIAAGDCSLPGLPRSVTEDFRALIYWLQHAVSERDLLAMAFLGTTPPNGVRPIHWHFQLSQGFNVACEIDEGVVSVESVQQEL